MKFIYLLLIIIILSACLKTSGNNQAYYSLDVEKISTSEDDHQKNSLPVLSNVTLENADNLDIFHTEIFVRSLKIKGGSFNDLTPLVNLRFLEELHIEKIGKFDDISPLGMLTNLKKLHLVTYDYDDFDLSPIAELTNLEELYLYANIKDITPLRTLVNLRKLELPGTSSYDSELPFSELVNLRKLYIGHDEANNTFSELLPLQQLEILRIFAHAPEELDITNIVQLHNLRVLIILSNRWDFQVKNINNLQNLVNLEVLEIKHDGNIDVSFVRPLKNLNTLGFRNSIINNVSPLLELPHLAYLYLDDSRVRDFSPLLKHPSIISITGFILDDGYAWSPVYDKFKEQGIEFWARTYDR